MVMLFFDGSRLTSLRSIYGHRRMALLLYYFMVGSLWDGSGEEARTRGSGHDHVTVNFKFDQRDYHDLGARVWR